MAVQAASANGGLERSSGGFLSGSSDFTYMYWAIPLSPTPAATFYRTYHLLRDTPSDNYISEYGGDGSNTIQLFGAIATASYNSPSIPTLLLENAYHVCVRYDNTAKTVEWLINGTLIDLISSKDYNGVTFTYESLLSENYAPAAVGDLAIQNYRSFQRKLTDDQIWNQMMFNTASDAGFTTNLFCDTPLSSALDLSDVSGNGRDWVALNSGVSDYTTYDVKFISGSANSSFATALTIPYLPYRLVQNAKPSSLVDLWYSFGGIALNNVVSAWGYSPNTTYNPILGPYLSEIDDLLGIGGQEVPIQFPIEGGTTYYLKAGRAGAGTGTCPIILQLNYIGTSTIDSGSIMDPDDTDGFPASVIGPNGITTFKQGFPAGEQGDALDSGAVLMVDAFASGQPIHIFDSDLNEIAVISSISGAKFARADNGQNYFAIGVNGTPAKLYTVGADGVLGSTSYTLDINNIGTPGSNGAIAISNDGTIGYYTSNGTAVERWDLTNNIALGEWLGTEVGYVITDIIINSDDTIFIMYFNGSTKDLKVERFNASGGLLDVYDFGTDHTSVAPRMSYSINNPDTFWVWTHTASESGVSNFREINVDTEAEVTNIPMIEFENGTSQEDKTPTPTSMFGGSFSCPFFQLRSSIIPPPPTNPLSGIYKIVPWSRKTNDTLYTSLDPVETEDRAIPNPFGEGPLLGN